MVALFGGRNSRPEAVEKLSSARRQQSAVNARRTEKNQSTLVVSKLT
jgi:hypothetical protein